VDEEPQSDKHIAAERQVHAKARRLLAALERIPPQIEAPGSPGAPESPREGHDSLAEGGKRVELRPASGEPQSASERRSWWRRYFGG
jgi:hypothetical protein